MSREVVRHCFSEVQQNCWHNVHYDRVRQKSNYPGKSAGDLFWDG